MIHLYRCALIWMDGDGKWNAAAASASWLTLRGQDRRLSAPLAGSQVNEWSVPDSVGKHRRQPLGGGLSSDAEPCRTPPKTDSYSPQFNDVLGGFSLVSLISSSPTLGQCRSNAVLSFLTVLSRRQPPPRIFEHGKLDYTYCEFYTVVVAVIRWKYPMKSGPIFEISDLLRDYDSSIPL